MIKSRRSSSLALALLATTFLSPPVPASAAPVPLGGEVQVNAEGTGAQILPAVAMDAAGDFVVVWAGAGQGDSIGIFAQRYDAVGAPQGSEFRVDTHTTDGQLGPAVAMDADGDFVVVWQSQYQDGDANGIYGQRFNAAGVPQGGEFRVNVETLGPQSVPAVAMDTDGNFVVTWHTVTAASLNYEVFARRYNAAGVPQGGEVQVNTFTAGHQLYADVAMDDSGDYAVTWSSADEDGDSYGVMARRYNSAGAAQGAAFQVNSHVTSIQGFSAIAMDADGDFVVAWTSYGQDGPDTGVFARRYDAAGNPQGGEFQVNSYTTDKQRFAFVAMDADGDFVVTWRGYGQDGSEEGVFAQAFNAAGQPKGVELQVNVFTDGEQEDGAVAMDPDGNFVVAWESYGQDASYEGIFLRRYAASGPAFADFDAEMHSDILWRNTIGGNSIVWLMNGVNTEHAASIGAPHPDWEVEDIGDTDGDRMADILWRHGGTGSTVLWLMDGAAKDSSASIGKPSTDWQVRGMGDTDGDGQADIVWRNTISGETLIWRMDGFTKDAVGSIGGASNDWKVAGLDDFDGDGKADVLWRHNGTGNTVVWRLDGFEKLASAGIGAPNLSWKIAGTGDFNGDGRADILWRHISTGNTVMWLMDGFAKQSSAGIGAPNLNWRVARVGDYGGDGKADILWRNSADGVTILWQMNGLVRETAQSIGAPSTDWQIQ